MKVSFQVTLDFDLISEEVSETEAQARDFAVPLGGMLRRQVSSLYGDHSVYVFGPDAVRIRIEKQIFSVIDAKENTPAA